jgi:hypothetical protein
MPKIVEQKQYDGAEARIDRLGLTPLIEELRSILTGFTLLVKEETDANGGAAVRKLVDEEFKRRRGWEGKKTGGIDWIKCRLINGTRVCIGVEIQFSARSDLLVVDIIHLRRALREGSIDVGVLVVPSDRLGKFLTDRGPKMADGKRHVEEAHAQDLPLVLIAIEHDGPGEALAKQAKRRASIR